MTSASTVGSGSGGSASVRARPGLDAPLGSIPEPRRDRPQARLAVDDAEVVNARRLLAELRPNGPGPEEDPDDLPHQGPAASMAPRAGGSRPPWDVEAPIGAFRRLSPALDAEVCARIARVPDERTRAVLHHLRTRGSLGSGFGMLAVRAALAVADEKRVTSWKQDAKHGYDRARVWGATRVDEAIAAWEATR